MRRVAWFSCLLLLMFASAVSAGAQSSGLGQNDVPHPSAAAVTRSTSVSSQLLSRSVGRDYGRLPLAFERNCGQTDRQVLFLAHGLGYSLFLTSDGAVISLKEGGYQGHRGGIAGVRQAGQTRASAVRFRFEGVNTAAAVSGLDELPGKTNYFIGTNPARWRTGIPNYKRIQYDGVYPGIQVVYYGTERQLEQDFVVLPGADPGRIAFRVQGSERVSLGADGDLRVALPGGELRLRRPVVYQAANLGDGEAARVLVEGQFVVREHNEVSFRLGPYDRSKALVIDPVLDYSSYLGGTDDDSAFAIAIDSSGEAYITGTTDSSDFPSTSGAVQTACSLNTLTGTCSGDAFVTKLSADGSTELFSTYLGGSGSETGLGIALDASGNAYVTGQTSSTDFPLSQFAYQQTFAPGCTASPNCVNAFVSKISSDGSQLLYSTYLGGNNVDTGNAIAVDSSGNAYVAGQTSSTNFPVTATTALQSQCGTDGKCNASGGAAMPDVFVSEVNPGASSGPSSLLYSTYLGGSGIDFGLGIALDSATSPNLYVTGSTQSADFPVTAAAAFQPACKLDANKVCEAEPFVLKLSPASGSAPSFTLAYSTYLGGSGGGAGLKSTDAGNAIVVDSTGKVYVTGETASTDFPVTARAFQTKCGTDGLCNPVGGVAVADAFVARLDPTTSGAVSLLYSTYLGGSGFDAGLGVAVGPGGVVYVTGGTDSADFPVSNPLQPSGGASAGGRDAFVTSLDSTESGLLFSTYLGGSADDTGNAIAVNSSGDAYVTGSTLSADFPTSASPFQPSNHGNRDAFVTLIGETTVPFVFLTPAPPISLTFPNQLLGTTSGGQTITLASTGSASLAISSITITGTNSGDFSETNNCGSSVAALASCTISVTFTPTAAGTRTATLTLTDDNSAVSGSTQSVSLTGTGSAPTITLTPTSLSFPSQILHTSSSGQAVTLKNTSTATISITSVSITGTDGSDFSETNTCRSSVSAGASCTITVIFTPTASGARSASVSIADAAAGSPQTVPLSGQGADFSLSVSPTSNTVSAGQTATYSLTVTPVGGFNQQVSLTCSNAPRLTNCSTSPASVTLTDGITPVSVSVTVTTTAPSSTFPGPRRLPPPDGLLFWLLGSLAAGALLLLARKTRSALVLALTVLALALWVSCGGGTSSGGGSTPGTTPGSYTLSLNGTSSGLTHSTNISLVVH
jgi:Beta-propeller repeat/Cep192 domain 4